jgi:glycosyltransferase involved in cell wall biosynthesis
MVSGKPKVAHILIPYLQKTETFIYDRVTNHVRYSPFILTDEPVINADIFPFGGPIYSLASRPAPLRTADTLFKKAAGFSPYFLSVLSRKKPAVVHAHFGPVGAAAAQAAKMLGIPLVVSFYGIDASALLDSPEYKKEYKRLFRAAAVVSVLSENMGERLARAGCPKDKLRVHHLAVDTAALQPKSEKPAAAGAPFKIVSAGRLVPKKGMALLVNAFGIMAGKGIDAELHIYGEGPLGDDIKKQIAEKKLSRRVKLHGRRGRAAVFDAMRGADAFALFSVTGPDGDSEGTPTVLIEAGALGLPSVSTIHAGIPEVVVDGRTGFLVDEYDVENFVSRLIQLAEHPRLRHTMGRAARTRIAAEFDIKKVMRKIESDYDSIVKSK